MPYILTDEPPGGQRLDAFQALDDAFGTSEFSQGQALTVIGNSLETPNSGSLFNDLLRGEYITETEN